MKKYLLAAAIALAMTSAAMADSLTVARTKVLTRLDHLSGTQWVVVISTVPNEITSITCDQWVMLGVGSWKHQNDFTIPAAPVPGASVTVMDANHFQGYCKAHGSIVAHTDDGDFVGTLDRGDGNWEASTKLTFQPK
jgi:hypothetical protein